MKRVTSLLLALLMIFAMVPSASADEGVIRQVTWINPLYADTISAEDIPAAVIEDRPETTAVAGSEMTAAVMLREQMKLRAQTVTIELAFPVYADLMNDIFYDAMEHTGVPDEGDYLHWQVGGYNGTIYSIGSRITLTYSFRWYTTAAQERTVEGRVSSVLSSLNVKNLTDYGKIRAIYDYITANVRYDYAHLSNENYKLQYTAYAALVNGTAVCQGYAVLFYRMALQAGVDNRVITGVSGERHAWNIVKLNGRYYDLDATWDEGSSSGSWRYFLRGSGSFDRDHIADPEYITAAFRADHPISSADYSGSTTPTSNGWFTENGRRYYYSNSRRATGLWTIGGGRYYFSPADGHMMTGLVTTGEGVRLFADNGRMLTGLQSYNGKRYYFSAKTGLRLTGLINTGGGQRRYFSAKNAAMVTGLVNTGNGILRYFDPGDGHMMTGLVTTAKGSRYFSAKDGRMMRSGWVTGPGGIRYLLDANGWVIETVK